LSNPQPSSSPKAYCILPIRRAFTSRPVGSTAKWERIGAAKTPLIPARDGSVELPLLRSIRQLHNSQHPPWNAMLCREILSLVSRHTSRPEFRLDDAKPHPSMRAIECGKTFMCRRGTGDLIVGSQVWGHFEALHFIIRQSNLPFDSSYFPELLHSSQRILTKYA
jgi:hypothetical protein